MKMTKRYFSVPLIMLLSILLMVSCSSTVEAAATAEDYTADYFYRSNSGEATISLVEYAPVSSDEMYTSAFGVGFDMPFDYSSLTFAEDEPEAAEDDNDPYSPYDVYDDYDFEEDDYSMVSPYYTGPRASRMPNEGVGRYWRGVSVANVDDSGYNIIDAYCFYETEHVYYYIDTAYTFEVDEEFIQIANAFEANYQRIRDIFGEEADVDRNGHVRFLITDMESSVIGYFYPIDKYSNSTGVLADSGLKSNESDMLYISTAIFTADSEASIEDVIGTLCHEFQHMVFFDERERRGFFAYTNMDKFVSEGLAMWTEAYCGYPGNLDNYIEAYLGIASQTSVFSDEFEVYGLGSLFFLYFEQVYGLDAISRLVETPETSIWLIEAATGKSFKEIFDDFALTVLFTIAEDTESDYYMAALAEDNNGTNLAMNYYFAMQDFDGLNLDYGNVVGAILPYSIGIFYNSGSCVPGFEVYTDDIDMYYVTTDWYSLD